MGEPSLLGHELIYKTLEKFYIIRNRLRTTYSRQKYYADNRRKDLEFEEGVFKNFTNERWLGLT